MDELLTTLARLTLGGSAAIALLILAGRAARGRYGSRWRCWAWLLLSLRLAVPVSLLPEGSPAPIQVPAPPEGMLAQPVAPRPPDWGADRSGPSGPQSPALPEQSVPRPAREPENVPGASLSLAQIIGAVWLAGAAGMLLWALSAHLRLLLYLRRWAVPVTDGETVRIYNELGDRMKLDGRPRLLACPGLRGPMLAGLLRPVLLLPQEEVSAPRYSLLHELTHFRRRDVWLKGAVLLANCVHWFNPLMWFMARLAERDMELACDEAALAFLPREEYAAYGQAILEAARNVPFS